jgi:hypothetical protein
MPRRITTAVLSLLLAAATLVVAPTPAGAVADPGTPVRCAPYGYDLVASLNWANQHRNGHFSGADLTGAVDLGGGRIAWLMGDTWVGGAANGEGGFIHNSALVQRGTCFEEQLGWNGERWAGLMGGNDPFHFYWPNDGILDGGRLWVAFTRYRVDSSEEFLGGVPDGQYLAELDPESFELISYRELPGGHVTGLGSAFVPIGDQVYVYGQRSVDGTHMPELVLARFTAGAISGPWEYWGASGWSGDADALEPVLGPVMNRATQVNVIDGEVVAIGQEGVFRDSSMGVYTAPDPTGPFTRTGTLMAIPNHDPEEQPEDDGYVYLGAVHPLGTRDAIVGWNYNTFNLPDSGIGDPRFYGARYSQMPMAPTPAAEAPTPSWAVGGASGAGGYWIVRGDGGVTAHGWAPFAGDVRGTRLNGTILDIQDRPGGGYWLVASDGGIFAYGGAQFHGSTGNLRLNKPIVGMAATPSGNGYWLVASDGGIFSFGDAAFYGSTGNLELNKPIIGMATAPGGAGYWLLARDGGIFNFGGAAFHGSMGAQAIHAVDIAPAEWGSGYWIFAADGQVYPFGAV